MSSRKQLLTVKPNRGHEIIAELENHLDVTVITQNVDNLHERAGSSKVIHLHGELTKVCSSYDPNNPHYIKELLPDQYEVKMGDLAGDGSQLRPYIVWFGESVPKINDAIDIVMQADYFVVIGTSLNVYPAAGLLNYVPDKVPVYLIDPKEVRVPSELSCARNSKRCIGRYGGIEKQFNLIIGKQLSSYNCSYIYKH